MSRTYMGQRCADVVMITHAGAHSSASGTASSQQPNLSGPNGFLQTGWAVGTAGAGVVSVPAIIQH